MEADLGFGFLLFRGTWRPSLQSLKSGLGPALGYNVRRCLLVFAYLPYFLDKPSFNFYAD